MGYLVFSTEFEIVFQFSTVSGKIAQSLLFWEVRPESRCSFMHYILHSYKCYQLILIIEFVPKVKYLCFDLMFLCKINQVILVAILLFVDLRSVLQMIFFVTFQIFFVTFYFFQFLFDQTILGIDECFFQTSKITTKSIGIVWQKVDASITFCKFPEKIVTFSSFICLN